MFEQMNSQSMALGKSYTDTFVKAQTLALAGFERITELSLKTFEDRLKASVDFWSEAAELRDFEAAKGLWPKGMQLAQESAQKFYTTSQEVMGVSMKTSEAIGSLAKGSIDSTNDTIAKQVHTAKKASGTR